MASYKYLEYPKVISVGYGVTANIAASHARSRQLGVRFPVSEFLFCFFSVMAPFKLAIIGAGPSAFYVASRLLSFLPHSNAQSAPFKIHMYDRLWAPHGLVRYGVAPDHPEVKVRSPCFLLA